MADAVAAPTDAKADDWKGQSPVEAAIAALPSLYSLELRGLYLQQDELLQLKSALGTLQRLRLTSADFSGNRLVGDAVDCLVETLLARGVQLLDLSWNCLCQSDIAVLEVPLQAASTALTLLDLECNDLGTAGTVTLAGALPGSRTLRRLLLGGNRIGPDGGRALAAALPRTALTGLGLQRNFLGPDGVAALAGVPSLPAGAPTQASQGGGCSLVSLQLAVNRARDHGAEALAKALEEGDRGFLPQLEVLDLGGNMISDTGACALARFLSARRSNIRLLGLSRNKLSSVAGEALGKAVEAGLNTAIQTIELDGNPDLPWTSVVRLSTALRKNCRSIVVFDPLEAVLTMCQAGAHEVDLRGIQLGPTGAGQLCAALRGPRVLVASLSLRGCGLGDAGMDRVAGTLHCAKRTLSELDLSWNRISAHGARCLVESLQNSPEVALSSLDLDCNDLGDAGVAALVRLLEGRGAGAAFAHDALPEHRGTGNTLRVLRLASNGIGPAGCTGLAGALKSRHVGLIELDLCRNRVGPAGAAALAEPLSCPEIPLRVLGLAVNRIGDAGASALAAALAARGPAREDRPPVDLNLRGNLIRDAGAVALAAPLAKGAVAGLQLEFNNVTGKGAEALAAGLHDALLAFPDIEASVCLQGNPAGSGGETAVQDAFKRARRVTAGGGGRFAASGSGKRQRLNF